MTRDWPTGTGRDIKGRHSMLVEIPVDTYEQLLQDTRYIPELEAEIERLRAQLANVIHHAEGDAQEIERLRAVNAELLATLQFFASVIKGGEPWTDRCEQAYRAAIARAEGREP